MIVRSSVVILSEIRKYWRFLGRGAILFDVIFKTIFLVVLLRLNFRENIEVERLVIKVIGSWIYKFLD